MKRAEQLTSAEIQKEQLFLVQLERELNNVLTKINENLNTLKVEELQLRSSAVNLLTNYESETNQLPTNESITKEEQTTFNDNPEMVNQQELDLDIYLPRFNGEEEDE